MITPSSEIDHIVDIVEVRAEKRLHDKMDLQVTLDMVGQSMVDLCDLILDKEQRDPQDWYAEIYQIRNYINKNYA